MSFVHCKLNWYKFLRRTVMLKASVSLEFVHVNSDRRTDAFSMTKLMVTYFTLYLLHKAEYCSSNLVLESGS